MKKWIIEILGQTDRFNDLDEAQARAKKYLDAGLWFMNLEIKEEKK